MLIRLCRPRADYPHILKLIRTELIPLSFTARRNVRQSVRKLPQRLRKGITFVASAAPTTPPAGFITLVQQKSALIIDMLAVSPQQQGKQIGRQLMLHAESCSKEWNCRDIYLYVDEGNHRAHRFYTRLGYQTINYHEKVRCYELHKALYPSSAIPSYPIR